MEMTLRKLAAKLLEDGKFLLADTALDIDAEGIKYEDLWTYALNIGVDEPWVYVNETELLDAIVALEQRCEFS